MEQPVNNTRTESGELRWVLLESNGEQPSVMFGHSAVVWKDSMYVFAGYSFGYLRDLFQFDFVKNEWNDDTTMKSQLPANLVGRQYHTSVVYDDQMWVLMGAGPGTVLKELFTYNFRTHVWAPIPINEDFPPIRYLQSAVVYKDAMWIFGGKSNTYNNDCINDIHRFDFKTMKWSEIKVPSLHPRPSQRRTHSAVVHNDCMYIFSGWNGAEYFDDMWEFNFELRRWSEVHTIGDKPTGRQLHTGVMYDGEMWVFGGYDSATYYDDLYKFNFETCMWTKFELEHKPSPRNAHTAVVYDSAMYILGGNNFFEAENSLWKLELPKRQRFTLSEQLANDLYGLYSAKRMTDVQLIISGKELQLHRFMLLARCPKLLELVEAGQLLQFDLFLGDNGAELLDNVIEFIYTDRLSVFRKSDWEMLFEVLEFAQAVNFDQLVHACEYLIAARARVDTVTEIKSRAISAPNLLAWCKYFIECTADIRDPSEMVPLLFEPKETAEEVRLSYDTTLTRDMLRLYTELRRPDLTIVTQARNFPVHRTVLLMRCPYFEGLLHFNQNTAGHIDHNLKISEEDFETILKFVYSSEVHFKAENFFSLISEASFYMIDSEQFYEACFEHFQSQISADNIAALCQIAAQFPEMTSVKSCLLEFIKANWASVKSQIDSWQISAWKKEILDLTAIYDVD